MCSYYSFENVVDIFVTSVQCTVSEFDALPLPKQFCLQAEIVPSLSRYFVFYNKNIESIEITTL